ncbi:hypothetical protein M513_02970 [Trichuris suis]|uniref:Uncharacterized protein n=1 Tax=Trichuris suis TaxID=68888 RepID=A0A085MG46_9BILA|nr:hypothetical protein M513_02970 [Trichuris suis]
MANIKPDTTMKERLPREVRQGIIAMAQKKLDNEALLLRKDDEIISLLTSLRESRLEASTMKWSVTKLTKEKENMLSTMNRQRGEIGRLQEQLAKERAEVLNAVKEKCSLELRLIEVKGQLVRQQEREQQFAALVDSTNAERMKHQEELRSMAELVANIRKQSNEHCFKAEAAQMSYARELGMLKMENDSLKRAAKLSQERAEKLETQMLEAQKRRRLETMEYIDKIFGLECSMGDDAKLMHQYYEKAAQLEEERKAALLSVECNRKIVKQVVSHASKTQREHELQLSLKDKLIAQLTSELRLFLKIGDGTIAHMVALDSSGTGQMETRVVTFSTLYHEYWNLVKVLLVTKAKFQLLKSKLKSIITVSSLRCAGSYQGCSPQTGKAESLEPLENETLELTPSQTQRLSIQQSESASADLSAALAFELPNFVEALNEPTENEASRGGFTYADEEGIFSQKIKNVENYRMLLSQANLNILTTDEQTCRASKSEGLREVPLLARSQEMPSFVAQSVEAAISSWKAVARLKAENAQLAEECKCCSTLLANQEERIRSLNLTMELLVETLKALQGAREQMKASETIAQRRCDRLKVQLATERRLKSICSSNSFAVAQSLSDARSKLVSLENELRDQAAAFYQQNKLAGVVSGLTTSLENIQKSSMESFNENLQTMMARQESLVDVANEATEWSEAAVRTSSYYLRLFRGKMKKEMMLRRRAEEQAKRRKERYFELKDKMKRLLSRKYDNSQMQMMSRLRTKIVNLTKALRKQGARLLQATKELNCRDAEAKYWKDLCESSERNLGATMAERHALESQLQEQLVEKNQLSDRAGQLAKAMEEADAQAQIRIFEHSHQLQEVHGRIALLAEQVDICQVEKDKLKNEADTLRLERDSLRHTVETLSSEIADVRSQFANCTAELKAKAECLEALSKEKENQLNLAKQELLDLKGKASLEKMTLVQEVNKSRKMIADFEKVKEQLLSRLSASSEPWEVGTSSGVPDVNIVRYLEEERKQAIDRCALAEAELLRARVRVSQLESKVFQPDKTSREEIEALKVEVDKKNKEIDALSLQLRQVSESAAALRKEADKPKTPSVEAVVTSAKAEEKQAIANQREQMAPHVGSLKFQNFLNIVSQQLTTIRSLERLTDEAEGLFDRVTEVHPPKVDSKSSLKPSLEMEHEWTANVASIKETLKELRCKHQKLRADCGTIMSSSRAEDDHTVGETAEPVSSQQPDQTSDVHAGSFDIASKREYSSPEVAASKRIRVGPSEDESAKVVPIPATEQATSAAVEQAVAKADQSTTGPADAGGPPDASVGQAGISSERAQSSDVTGSGVSLVGDVNVTESAGEIAGGQRMPIVWDANGGERRPVPVLIQEPRTNRRGSLGACYEPSNAALFLNFTFCQVFTKKVIKPEKLKRLSSSQRVMASVSIQACMCAKFGQVSSIGRSGAMAHLKLRAGKRAKFTDPDGHFERMVDLLRKEAQSATGRSSSSLGTLAFSNTTTSQQTQILIAEERRKMEAVQQQLVKPDSFSSNMTYNPSVVSVTNTSKRTGRASSIGPDSKYANKRSGQEISQSKTTSRIKITQPYPGESISTAMSTTQPGKEPTVAKVQHKADVHSINTGSIQVVDNSRKCDDFPALKSQSAAIRNEGKSGSFGRRDYKSGRYTAPKSQQTKDFTKVDSKKGTARKINSAADRFTKSREESAPSRSSEDFKSTEPKTSSESLQLTKIIRENMARSSSSSSSSSTFDPSDFVSDCTTTSPRSSELVEQTSPKLKYHTVIHKLPSIEDTPKLSRPEKSSFLPVTSTPVPGRAAALDASISIIQPFKNVGRQKPNSQNNNLPSCQRTSQPTVNAAKRLIQLRRSEPTMGPATSTPLRNVPSDLNASASTIVEASVDEVFSSELESCQKRKQTVPKRRSTIGWPDATPKSILKRKVNTPMPKSYKTSTTKGQKLRRSGVEKTDKKKATYALDSLTEMSEDDDRVCATTMHSVSSVSDDTSVVVERQKRMNKKVQSRSRNVASVKESKQRKRRDSASPYERGKVALPPKRAKKDDQSNKKFKESTGQEASLGIGGKLLARREKIKKKREQSISACDNRGSALPIREFRNEKNVRVIDQQDYLQGSWPTGAISPSLTEGSVFGCNDDESTFTYTPTFVGPRTSKLSYQNVSSIDESDSNSVHSCSTRSRRASEKQSRKASYALDNGGTKSEDLSEMQSSSSASPPTCSYDVSDHTSADTPIELASVSKNRRKSEMELSKEIINLTPEEGSVSSAPRSSSFETTLPTPEISWGSAREKTPGRRRSSRTRVPRLRHDLGEAIKYEYVDGGLRRIAGVVPGHVEYPTLKRNKVHTMSQYVELLCKKKRNGRKNDVGSGDASIGRLELDHAAIGRPLLAGTDADAAMDGRLFRLKKARKEQMTDRVLKYEHDEVSEIRKVQIEIRVGGELNLSVENTESIYVINGVVVVILNGSAVSLSIGDYLTLRAVATAIPQCCKRNRTKGRMRKPRIRRVMAYLRLRAGTRSNFADQESPFERIADWLRKEAQSATGRRSSPLGTLAFLNITDSQKTKVLIEEVKRKIEVVQQQLRRADPASSSATYRLSEEPVQNTSRKTARLSSRAFDFNDANEPIEPELSQSKITSTNDSVSKAKSMTQPEKEAIAVLVTSADEKSQSRQMNAHMSRNASMEAEKTISAYYDTQREEGRDKRERYVDELKMFLCLPARLQHQFPSAGNTVMALVVRPFSSYREFEVHEIQNTPLLSMNDTNQQTQSRSELGHLTSTPVKKEIPDLNLSLSTIVGESETSNESSGKDSDSANFATTKLESARKRRQIPKAHVNTPMPNSFERPIRQVEKQLRFDAKEAAEQNNTQALAPLTEILKGNSAPADTVHSTSLSDNARVDAERRKGANMNDQTRKRNVASVKESKQRKRRDSASPSERGKVALPPKRAKRDEQSNKKFKESTGQEASLGTGGKLLARRERIKKKREQSISARDNRGSALPIREFRNEKNVHLIDQQDYLQGSWPTGAISPSLTEGSVFGCNDDESTFTYTPTFVGPRTSKLSYRNVSSIEESDRNGVHDCSTRSRRVSEEQSRKTSYAVDNGGTKSEDLPEMQSSSSASPPTCSYDVNDHTSAHMPFELASVSKNRRKSEIELTKARVSRDSSTRKSVTKVSSTQKRGNENRKRTTNAHLHTFSEITKLTAQAGSPPLASSSRLRSPEISWGNAREKTPGRRRSSRTRVPRLRPELGEVIKYEYVDGGLRQIVGVVPGYVDHPTLKRNKVHTMSQYVDLLCKKRLDRRNVQRKTCKKGTRQVNRMGAGELHPVAPDGDVLTERRPFHFTCQEMADGVVKYEHDEVTAIALLNIRRGAEFRLNVERNQTFCVAKGAIMITLNGSHMNLSARDFVILRAATRAMTKAFKASALDGIG